MAHRDLDLLCRGAGGQQLGCGEGQPVWAFTAPADGLTAHTVPRGLTALLFGWLGGALGSLCAQEAPQLPEQADWGRGRSGDLCRKLWSRLRSSSVGCVWKVWSLLSPRCDSGAGTEVPTVRASLALFVTKPFVGDIQWPKQCRMTLRAPCLRAPWGCLRRVWGDTCQRSQCWEGGLALGG